MCYFVPSLGNAFNGGWGGGSRTITLFPFLSEEQFTVSVFRVGCFVQLSDFFFLVLSNSPTVLLLGEEKPLELCGLWVGFLGEKHKTLTLIPQRHSRLLTVKLCSRKMWPLNPNFPLSHSLNSQTVLKVKQKAVHLRPIDKSYHLQWIEIYTVRAFILTIRFEQFPSL